MYVKECFVLVFEYFVLPNKKHGA